MPYTEIQRRHHQTGCGNPRTGPRNLHPVSHVQEPLSRLHTPNPSPAYGPGLCEKNVGFEQRQQLNRYSFNRVGKFHQQQQQNRSSFNGWEQQQNRYPSCGPGMYKTNRLDQQQQQQCYRKGETGMAYLNRKPQLFIRYAQLSIRRAFVACVDPGVSWLTTLLRFQPVSDSSLAHLSGESLYTLALYQTPEQILERSAELYRQDSESDAKLCPTNKPLSSREVADSVIDNLYSDMSKAMDYARSYLESRFWVGVKPKLWLRFGRMLFHSRQNRADLAALTPFDAEGLEKSLHGPKTEDSVLKTFDTGVSHDYFRKVRELARGDGFEVPATKERFIIQVEDATHSRFTLICTCRRSLTADGPRLTLCKVRTEPLRHMVADFACMGQELDLRLILTTRQEFKDDTLALQTIIGKAVYDVKAEGGLSWPLGSTCLGPYTVTGASHVMKTNIKFEGQRWKLRHANRTAVNATKARFSYEIDVTLDTWIDQFQVWENLYKKENDTKNCEYVDCYFKPLSTLFSWVWENYI